LATRFLVVMAAVYVAWLVSTEKPRLSRALWAAAAIAVGHLAYLIVLANSERLLAALPQWSCRPESETNMSASGHGATAADADPVERGLFWP